MKRVGALNTYRLIMIFVHFYFAQWIIDVWGFRLKTFLFLTKINFFTNFFYFFYTGAIMGYLNYKAESKDATMTQINRVAEEQRFANSTFKFSFCLSVAVNILYWSLFFFAPTMLGTTPTPLILELFLHGGNMFVLLIDAILNWGVNKGNENLLASSFLIKFTIFYFMLQYLVYYTMNIEVYPMVSKLSIPQYSMVGAAGYALFRIGDYFHDRVLHGHAHRHCEKMK